MKNVLVAFNKNQVNDLLDNFRFDSNDNRVREDYAPFYDLDPYNGYDLLVLEDMQGGWKEESNTVLVTLYVTDFAMVEYLKSHFDGKFKVLGAWEEDGTLSDAYKLHPQILKWMPDVVVVDFEGNELSRTDATEVTPVSVLAGQAVRQL
jgi:hypothetical protein